MVNGGTFKDRNAVFDHWYVPDTYKIQTAGYIGLISAGLEYSFLKDHVALALFYGYVPKNVGGKRIDTIAFKYGYYPAYINLFDHKVKICPLYIGITNLFGVGDDYYLKLPSKYEKDYYKQTANYRSMNLGVEVLFYQKKTGVYSGFFAEVSILDYYFSEFYEKEYLSFKDIITLAVGYKITI